MSDAERKIESMTGASLLYSRNLQKRYKKRYVVNDVSVEVRQGEVVGLLGPNGAGKTTTFYMMVGMVKPNSGSVFIDNTQITGLPMYKRARLGIGYLPQEASIFRKMTVEDNIIAILEYRKMDGTTRKNRADQLIEELGLSQIRKTLGYALSGGERRRTEIARSLATDPKFMLLDEPFAGIDPLAVEDIMKIVVNLRKRGIGVLITDHNVHETLSIVDRAYLLFEGKILKEGTSQFLADDPEAKKLYLGENFRLDRY